MKRVHEKLVALANKIRSYTKKTELLGLDEMNKEIDSSVGTSLGGLIGKTLENLVIPEGCTSIGKYAFYEFNSLKSVTVDTDVDTVESKAFVNCRNLERVTFRNIGELIGSTFDYCPNLSEIHFENIDSIGNYICSNCASLKLWDLSKATKIPTIGSSNYFSTESKILVPLQLYDSWVATSNWKYYDDYLKAKEEGVLYNRWTNQWAVTGFDPPEGFSGSVNKIAEDVNEVPVKTIYNEALANKGITSITLPSSLTDVGTRACENPLWEINIPEDSKLAKIGSKAFYYTGDKPIYERRTLNLPSSVISLGDKSFYDLPYTDFDFSTHATVPSVSGNPFSQTRFGYEKGSDGTLVEKDYQVNVIVPTDLYDSWKKIWVNVKVNILPHTHDKDCEYVDTNSHKWTCRLCGRSVIESHKITYFMENEETHGSKCEICGVTLSTNEPHTMSSNAVDIGEEGHSRSCTCNCGHYVVESHDEDGYSEDSYCDEEGWYEYYCSVCGKTMEEGSVQPTGHYYVCEVTEEPTSQSSGTTTCTCVNCGDSYEESIEPIDQD